MTTAGDHGPQMRPVPGSPADPWAELHVPVLADRVIQLLAPALQRPGAVYLDGTLGMGGHTLLMLRTFPQLRVVGLDRDPQALAIATERVAAAGFSDRVQFVHAVYDEVARVVDGHVPGGRVDGMLFDLGVSSLQLDRTERGFAYAVDAPLDMRMDTSAGPTAADVLNTYSVAELTRVLREYGEERFAGRIAAAVVRERATQPWTTSARLVELIRACIPAAARRTGGHPAKRTFQALRVEVNDELAVLRRAVPAAVSRLAVGGRLAFLSFQSLEDRIVKKGLTPLTVSTAPPGLPVELPGHEPQLRLLTRGGSQAPSAQEIAQNPRAASARLRAVERVREAPPNAAERSREVPLNAAERSHQAPSRTDRLHGAL